MAGGLDQKEAHVSPREKWPSCHRDTGGFSRGHAGKVGEACKLIEHAMDQQRGRSRGGQQAGEKPDCWVTQEGAV